jgi:hypothetical protein
MEQPTQSPRESVRRQDEPSVEKVVLRDAALVRPLPIDKSEMLAELARVISPRLL